MEENGFAWNAQVGNTIALLGWRNGQRVRGDLEDQNVGQKTH